MAREGMMKMEDELVERRIREKGESAERERAGVPTL